MEAIRDLLSEWKKSGYFISEFTLAADELFTNAIYNAPLRELTRKTSAAPLEPNSSANNSIRR